MAVTLRCSLCLAGSTSAQWGSHGAPSPIALGEVGVPFGGGGLQDRSISPFQSCEAPLTQAIKQDKPTLQLGPCGMTPPRRLRAITQHFPLLQ